MPKVCRTCDEEKSLDDFAVDRKARDGRCGECRSCAVDRATAWRKANPERFAAGHKASRQRHNDRQNARGAVTVALRKGTLVREPCEVCGTVENVHAHHDDYTKRLDVRWLCQTHHAEHHRQRPRSEVTSP